MSENKKQLDRFDALRDQAEKLVRYRPDDPSSPSDILELIHELKVHQAELEIQNEELQRAQQDIAALHKEYADLYEFAPCGYIVLSSKKVISRVNLTGVKLLGAERIRLMGMPLSSFFTSGSQGVYFGALQLAAQSGDRQSVEINLKDDDDPHTWIRADIQPDLDDAGELLQWRLVLVDVTEEKKAEQKALDYRNKLKSLHSEMTLIEERVKHTLYLRIHDQICQTVAISRVKMGMMADSEPDPKQKAILNEVYSDLGDVLDETRAIMSEIDSPILEMFGLKKAILGWATHNIEKKHHVAIVVTGDDGGKPLAEDTKNILFRGARELLYNIVKHAQATQIKVNIKGTDNLVEIRVSDNGRGFPVDVEPEGLQSGFGIQSIRESMDRLGGRLTIDSAPGKGCTAILIMPIPKTQ